MDVRSVTVPCSVPGVTRIKHDSPTSAGTSSVASKYEELECLYAAVGKVIYEGLTNYEKATNANPSQLFGKPHVCSSHCAVPPNECGLCHELFLSVRSLQSGIVQRRLREAFGADSRRARDVCSLGRKGRGLVPRCSWQLTWQLLLEVGSSSCAGWKPFVLKAHWKKMQHSD